MARNEDDNGGAMTEARTESKGQGLVRPRGLATRRRVRREKRGGARERQAGEKDPPDRAAPKLLTGRSIGETKLLRGSSDADYVPPRRHPDWIVEGEVAKFGVTGDGATAERANKVARSKEPVVLANTGFATKLCSKWTFAYLSRALDDAFVKGGSAPAEDDEAAVPDPRVSVSCSMDKKNRFIHIDAGKNVYGSFYHVREPETIPLDSLTSFKDFADCAGKWTERHVAANKRLMKRREAPAFAPSSEKNDPARVEAALQENYRRIMRPNTMPDILLAPRSKAYHASPEGLPCIRGDLTNLVRWQWLFSFLGSQNFGSVRDCSLHCGTRNGLHPCKYEESDRLIAQVTGKTRLLLISPSLAFAGLYPYPVHHPLDKYSMVDFEAGDETNAKYWPLFKEKIRGKECILHPGDVLYIPQYYFVHRQDLSPENSVLEFNISQGQRTRSEAAVPLKVSRLLEERVSALESVRDAHRWLSVIAHGEESEWIDTSTVKGHARIKFVESVHEEVEKNLGKNQTSPFLKSLTDRRLMPTPWLNKKDFREPLYLLDKPFTISDDRSELEKKYPEFFRAKLKKEGWNVPDSESTVPIPGYNC